MDSVSFGFGLTLNTNVGCVPMASFDEAGAGRPCGLARSRDASTDAPAD
jgi:hypothetical protein